MSDRIARREKTLIEKFGSREALAAKRREWQAKSMLNPKRQKGAHKGGFSYMSPEQRRVAQAKSVESRKRNAQEK